MWYRRLKESKRGFRTAERWLSPGFKEKSGEGGGRSYRLGQGQNSLGQSQPLASLGAFEADDGLCSTPLQEPAGVYGFGLVNDFGSQSVEDEFELVVGRVKRLGHPEEGGLQSGPAFEIDYGVDFRCGRGEIGIESDLPNTIRGDGLEDWLDPMTGLPELDETESHLLEAPAWG